MRGEQQQQRPRVLDGHRKTHQNVLDRSSGSGTEEKVFPGTIGSISRARRKQFIIRTKVPPLLLVHLTFLNTLPLRTFSKVHIFFLATSSGVCVCADGEALMVNLNAAATYPYPIRRRSRIWKTALTAKAHLQQYQHHIHFCRYVHSRVHWPP